MQQDLNDAQEKGVRDSGGAAALARGSQCAGPAQPNRNQSDRYGQQASGTAQSPPKLDNGLPTPPPKPPLPVHADRYSSDVELLPAEDMVPGKPAGTAASPAGAGRHPGPAEPETERKKPALAKGRAKVVPATGSLRQLSLNSRRRADDIQPRHPTTSPRRREGSNDGVDGVVAA